MVPSTLEPTLLKNNISILKQIVLMQSDIKISVGQAVLDDQNSTLHSLIKTAWPTNVSNGILQFLRLFALVCCSDMYLAYFLHHIFYYNSLDCVHKNGNIDLVI